MVFMVITPGKFGSGSTKVGEELIPSPVSPIGL